LQRRYLGIAPHQGSKLPERAHEFPERHDHFLLRLRCRW